jgi:hypothetical protein
MSNFYNFMTRNTRWNLPVWFAGFALVVVAGVQFIHNVVNFLGV